MSEEVAKDLRGKNSVELRTHFLGRPLSPEFGPGNHYVVSFPVPSKK